MTGRRVGFVDVTTRDGHQSLWATRMTNGMILPFMPRMDEMGFDWINLEGGAVFDVCVRFLHEDPWERMRLVAQRTRRTPVDIMTRGQSLFTFRFFADDVVALTVRRIRANGMRRITVYDALNDVRNLELSVRVGQQEGLHVCAGMVYTLSPVHTDAYYVSVAEDLVRLGADSVFIKDPSGLLTPDRVRTLVPAVRAAVGDLPLELHSHSLSGMAEPSYLEAVPLGVDVLHTASHPLASGASLPPTEYCVRHLEREGFVTDLSLSDLDEMADYFTGIARRYGFPPATPHRYDPALYRHQVPGGMISNLRADLARMGMSEREPEILEEVEQVRVDLGYPILVSPFAQFVVVQAILNVTQGERYSAIPDEVRRYVLGHYGRLAAPALPKIVDRVLDEAPPGTEALTGRPGEIIDPALPALRAERGPFDSDDDLLLAAFYSDRELADLLAARSVRRVADAPLSATTPLLELLRGIAEQPRAGRITVSRPGFRLHIDHGRR
ncbi:pyruvate carboxylase subunit B [Amycolatopsis alkalitolerans]|uniref:Pyruvate carboxylase subunit B n=1 Tax=Amycolatopsis alkalitolerans TaxID=2547244 RepID=A0A5C4M285_9PSEU|nr:pyruvate carboxylase subunit B [Amycolatopsis alkalitolerans]TNC25762.1 pyruvate carboxylase subunit B [Amycolatopsis alkalitolerans]